MAVLAVAAACRRGGGGRAHAEWTAPPPIVVRGVGFANPEGVVHDPDEDVYFVSNVNGSPGVADDNGFISVLSDRGEVLNLKWIDGIRDSVILNAPTGVAIGGRLLYVADINTIRRFDLRTGAPAGEIPVPGAASLAGMTSAGDGSVYFTDSGSGSGPEGSSPAGDGAVYRLRPDGRLDTLMKGSELGHPTAIAVAGDSVWVVSRSGELYRIADGRRLDIAKLPHGGVDGLVVFGGEAFIASREARAILRGRLGGPFQVLLGDLDDPVSIGHDIWRNRILVPLPKSNEVEILRLAF
jgi:hypothetical protein